MQSRNSVGTQSHWLKLRNSLIHGAGEKFTHKMEYNMRSSLVIRNNGQGRCAPITATQTALRDQLIQRRHEACDAPFILPLPRQRPRYTAAPVVEIGHKLRTLRTRPWLLLPFTHRLLFSSSPCDATHLDESGPRKNVRYDEVDCVALLGYKRKAGTMNASVGQGSPSLRKQALKS